MCIGRLCTRLARRPKMRRVIRALLDEQRQQFSSHWDLEALYKESPEKFKMLVQAKEIHLCWRSMLDDESKQSPGLVRPSAAGHSASWILYVIRTEKIRLFLIRFGAKPHRKYTPENWLQSLQSKAEQEDASLKAHYESDRCQGLHLPEFNWHTILAGIDRLRSE